MTNDIAIKVENLSKVYKLYNAPIDRLKEALNPFKKKYHKDFYALNGISFEVKKGDCVGIVGRNGAGKSTLLKIITGVLTPTGGRVTVNGRVSALLELGAGFNPEYTGLENIYFQGNLMGFSKLEMDARVQNILEFADIGDFIHQPVKSYSSGMFARLAFSVAINVEPEILIVDEALSTGDFMFQFKCLQKIKEFRRKGVTILFVSHSAQSIIEYCNYAVFLYQGGIHSESYDVKKLIYTYEEYIRTNKSEIKGNDIIKTPMKYDEYDFLTEPNQELAEHRIGTHAAILREVYFIQDGKEFSENIVLEAGLVTKLKIIILSKEALQQTVVGMSIRNISGLAIWGDNTLNSIGSMFELKEGVNVLEFEFNLSLKAGEYVYLAGLADFSTGNRIELDQRWPMKKITVISNRNMSEGFIFAPLRYLSGLSQ
ncbi:ABC transporter ATP-binding protein [Aquella oligotrophica]|uniref:ABC transporter ATP-binding protein n=1 Tax=Aquella oligotrophica TaxID=2067065 RepID=A0A2I7N570_9NEIS|nr:ABC transporter ATP-binding protein [Aquella oligotrophica]AUR51592.1 ABC transporter ATP-binding protein [Aquella oligotrophica]